MQLLSVREAATRLGISPGLVYGLCARKRIRHERHGLGRGTIKIPEDAVNEYRQSVTVETQVELQQPRRLPLVRLKHLSV